MKNDIWATLFQKISTDEQPQHDQCPPGSDSWCTWQQAKAEDTLNDYVHNRPLSNEVIKPIYEELSKDDLLNSCLVGYTLNSNESFNSVLWTMAPKSISSGLKVLSVCSDLAVCILNHGTASVMNVARIALKSSRKNEAQENLSLGGQLYGAGIED
ncbi:hypothetical protein WA026_022454 [Henosepilachna vigintioctopunctata]|uniref:Uncharacterized protein n=1 Tax=Henosepilachna vigintioctopunctata TaxID=420089 RepID=A0AAW1U089_9CUCU